MFKKIWKWIVGIGTIIGAALIYVLLNKSDADKRVSKIEEEINVIEKDIKTKEKNRKKLLSTADDHATVGKKIDKEIEKAKKKQVNLDDKRKKMKSIFGKYGA